MSDKASAKAKAAKASKPEPNRPEAPSPSRAAGVRDIGDTIFVRDFVVDCNVGVYAEEQGVTQKVAFTVEARLAPHVHAREDAMVEVPSYADIIDSIVDLARAGHINLGETFGERIAE
ncbi:MAG: dihydroneopterin aldolase, partial [Hyphomicrobium sp.]